MKSPRTYAHICEHLEIDPDFGAIGLFETFIHGIRKKQFTPEQIYYVINQMSGSACTKIDKTQDYSIATLLIKGNKKYQLHFFNEKLFTILKKCDLDKTLPDLNTAKILLVNSNKSSQLYLTPEQLVVLLQDKSLSNNQTTHDQALSKKQQYVMAENDTGVQDLLDYFSGNDFEVDLIKYKNKMKQRNSMELGCLVSSVNLSNHLNLSLDNFLDIFMTSPLPQKQIYSLAGVFYFLNPQSSHKPKHKVTEELDIFKNQDLIRELLKENKHNPLAFDAFIEKLHIDFIQQPLENKRKIGIL